MDFSSNRQSSVSPPRNPLFPPPVVNGNSRNVEAEKLQQHLSLLREEHIKLQNRLFDLENQLALATASMTGSSSPSSTEDSFPKKLLKVVADLHLSPRYSDVSIVVSQSCSWPAHRFVLAARSSFWTIEDLQPELDWRDVPESVADVLLRWIYTSDISMDQDEEMLLGLITAANKFKVLDLVARCEDRLISLVSMASCIRFYTTADEIGTERLKNHCAKLISTHWDGFTAEDFQPMSARLLYGMIRERSQFPLHAAIQLKREDVVFLFLIERSQELSVRLAERDASGNLPLALALSTGQWSLAKTLVEHGANVDARDSHGFTLLHRTILDGNVESARFLIEQGADAGASTLQEQSTPLHLLCGSRRSPGAVSSPSSSSLLQSSELVDLLVERGASVNAKDCRGRAPLHIAIETGSAEVVERLLSQPSINLDMPNADGAPPLWLALQSSFDLSENSLAAQLVRQGASVDAIQPDTSDSLPHLCALHSLEDAALFLLQHGAQTRHLNRKGESVLHLASERGLCSLITALLEAGANPNAQSAAKGETPLHLALQKGEEEAVKTILKCGVNGLIPLNVEIRDKDGRTPLGLALELGNYEIARELVRLGASMTSTDPATGDTLLHSTLRKANEEAALFLIENGGKDVVSSKSFSTLLFLAIDSNLPRAVDALCRVCPPAPSDIGGDFGSEDEAPPLWVALEAGKIDVASALVRYGVDVEGWCAGPEGCRQTILHKAIDENNQDAACFLIRSGCSVDVCRRPGPDGSGGDEARDKATPLHLSAQWGLEQVMETLLEFGANVQAQDVDGQTPLHVAIANHASPQMISMLLSHPLNDLTVTDKFGKTPFAVAMATKNNKAAQLIADRHPSAVDMYDVRGRTYLHAAVQRGDLEGMLFLLSLGVDVNARTRDSDRFTPLHLAIKNATNAVAPGVSESIVRHLLLAGSDPNASTVRRITPGHLAIATPDLLQILLDGGADPNSVDDEHFNFLHTAMKESRLPAVRVLLRHGKVNTTAVTLRGYTPLHLLARWGSENSPAILDALLEAVPDYPIDKQDAEGNSALLLGYMRGHSGLCKSLVKYGACLGTPNKQGVTIFNYQLATKTLLLRLLDCVGCEPPWAESETCLECGNRFSLTTRKHHCRHCGRILCSKCSSSVIPIIKFGLNKPIRVCQLCFDVLTLGAS